MRLARTRFGAVLAMVALAASLVVATGCWRVHYTSDRPKGITHVETETYFLYGLLGDTVVDVRELCPGGAAEIVRYADSLNVVLWVVTLGIYTPARHAVTCVAVYGEPGGADGDGADEREPASPPGDSP